METNYTNHIYNKILKETPKVSYTFFVGEVQASTLDEFEEIAKFNIRVSEAFIEYLNTLRGNHEKL